jgi:hypothetical protein
MAFDLLEALTGSCKLFLRCFLGLFDEGVEHGDHPLRAIAIQSPADAGAAFDPELEKPGTQGLGVGCPELGSMVFQQIQKLITTNQEIDRPGLDLRANAGAVVHNAERPFHVSARATSSRVPPSSGQDHRELGAAAEGQA